ncbi:hypothetical protein HispidOSU_012227 [Sigmodon hispidus]
METPRPKPARGSALGPGGLLRDLRGAMLSGTELSQKGVDLTEMRSGTLGHCRHFFWLGVAFDAVGVAVLFTGVFANLLFYDMLLYLGSIVIFVSLLWWIFWYTGNIEALPEDLSSRTSTCVGEVGVHRSGSLSFSLTLRSVSNSFLRIRRRRRRRLHPRVLKTISNLSSDQLGGNSDAGTERGRTSSHPAKVLKASRSLPLAPLHRPLSVSTSRSQPVFSVTSQCFPPDNYSQEALSSDSNLPLDLDPQGCSNISVTSRIYPLVQADNQSHLVVPVPSESFPMVSTISQSQIQSSSSSSSCVPGDLDTQALSKISVTSRFYPLKAAASQSHLVVPMPSESFPMVPMISQSQIRGSAVLESQLQNLPPTSQTQPETVKAAESCTLAREIPAMPSGFTQTPQSRSPCVPEAPKNSRAKATETLPVSCQKPA